jgi:hypothetical protein
VFVPIKKVLNSHRYRLYEDIKAIVMQWFQQLREFFAEGTHQLPQRPQGLLLTISIRSPRTIPKRVSFEQALYIHMNKFIYIKET